jgi:hypothetical protein
MKNILLFILSLLLVACTKGKNDSLNSAGLCPVISIAPEKAMDVDFNDIVENPFFIQLETNSSCLLKWIHKVQICRDRIYIYNSDNAGKVFCFDMEGKYLFTVGARGEGPKEYGYLTDMYVDEPNNCIWLGDDRRKILKYDLDGNFIETHTTLFSIKNLIPIEKDIMAISLGYFADRDYSYINYSIKDKEIIYCKEATNKVDRMISSQTFSSYNGKIIYASGFNDMIFEVKKSGLSPKYMIDFNNHKVPAELLKDNNKDLIANFLNPRNRYAGLIRSPIETKDHITFNYDFSGNGLFACYSKTGKKAICIRNVVYNRTEYNASKSFFMSKVNHGYVSFLASHLLTEKNETNDLRQTYGKYDKFAQLIPHLRAEDNPILIIGEVMFDRLPF